ncbi:hypothetical protein ACHAPG_005158 [Botrytis cinerea]
MLMDRRTTLPSAEAPLDFYLRVLYGKRVGILVDVGEAVGYDCLHMWLHELHYAEQKPESRHIRRRKFSLGLKPVIVAERTLRVAYAASILLTFLRSYKRQ